MPPVVSATELDASKIDSVAHLVERVTELDGVRPLSESVSMALSDAHQRQVRHFYAVDSEDPERIIAYGCLNSHNPAHPQLEMALDKGARRSGLGGIIVDQALQETAGRLDLWAHGRADTISQIAASRGLLATRTLFRMRRTLADSLPLAPLPAEVSVRAFVRGRDNDPWLAVNAAAFADLPDQGSWGPLDLARRMREDWFDPSGFLLAISEDEEIVGFHWTKVHRPQADEGFADPVGEVYVLGIDPQWQGRGLGRALTVLGMAYLQGQGLREIILYVDASNVGAIKTYERLGFVRYETDTLYSSPVPARPS